MNSGLRRLLMVILASSICRLSSSYLNIVKTQDAGGEDDGKDGEPVAGLAVARVDVA